MSAPSFPVKLLPPLTRIRFDVRAAAFDDSQSLNLTDEQLRQRVLTPAQATALLDGNLEVFTEVVRQAVTKEDLVALGYRRRQLEVFERLLQEPTFFDEMKPRKRCGAEVLWQRFFDKNAWISAMGYATCTGRRSTTRNSNNTCVAIPCYSRANVWTGCSKAIASTLCFVEIKHHRTELLAKQPYRPTAMPRRAN